MSRNVFLALAQKNDPCRFRSRTVPSKKGKGGKVRPRRSNRALKELGV